MTARPDDDFDPRFDPAFQRGFEQRGAGQRRTEQSGTDRGADQPRALAREARRAAAAPVSAPAPAFDASGSAYASAPIAAPPTPSAISSDQERADVAADADRPAHKNPFLIALGVLSVALVAVGVWGVQLARQPFLETNLATNIDFVGLQILQMLAPVAIGLGVATAIGILFVLAVGWQKRRP